MKKITYKTIDFPTGFLADQMCNELIAAHGKSFNLTATPGELLELTLDDTDNEAAIRITCIAHFAKTPAQRTTDLADLQAVSSMGNGNKDRRFMIEMLYQADQRFRVLESRPAITKLQFTNGIKNIYRDI